IVTGSGPAGRKTSANPHASAAAPITTTRASRTAERGGRVTERLPARAAYIFGNEEADSNSRGAHTVGQALAPSSIVPIAGTAEVPKFRRAQPDQIRQPPHPRSPDARCPASCARRPARHHPHHHSPG